MPKTYNISPYYDDFGSSKNFHQILFNPGLSVQARELTQLQTILRDQIEKFGNHIFQHGSVVIPGNSYYELTVDCVKVASTFNGTAIDPAEFEGKRIVSPTGSVAVVKKAIPATATDPVTFYVGYISGGSKFDASQTLYVQGNTSIQCTTLSSNQTGSGSLAYVNPGVYYVKGTFVEVAAQSVVLSKYTNTPTTSVALQITESIVTAATDDTLLDPAQGSYNYAAPGADRVKIELTLVTRDPTGAVSEDFIDLMRFENGNLQEFAKYAKYSELEKSMARRTYDQSGDYRVSGLDLQVIENKRTAYNDGADVAGDPNKLTLRVSPGKAYIRGFEAEAVGTTSMNIDKARTADHIAVTSASLYTDYSSFMYVSDVHTTNGATSAFGFAVHETVSLKDPSGATIGTANVTGIDYATGNTVDNTTIYKLYFHDLQMNLGYVLSQVKTITGANSYCTLLTRLSSYNATVTFPYGSVLSTSSGHEATCWTHYASTGELYVYRSNQAKLIPITGETVTSASGSAIVSDSSTSVTSNGVPVFQLPVSAINSVKNSSNVSDIAYTIWGNFVVDVDNSGNGTVSTSLGTFVAPGPGNTVAVDKDGVNYVNYITSPSGNTLQISGTPVNMRNTKVYICAQVTRVAQPPKTKTLVTPQAYTTSVASPKIFLRDVVLNTNVQDAYQLLSVVTNAGVDVTSKYKFDSGATDYYYDDAFITLVGTLPSGTTSVTITFTYFTHAGSSDYFSVDSYTTLGANYIQLTPTYTTKSTNVTLDLAQVLDFRPRKNNGSFVQTPGLYSGVVTVGSLITTSIKYYLPRYDRTYMDKSGKIHVARGIPAVQPRLPQIPTDVLGLHKIYLEPYTASSDNVRITEEKNIRYTMADIHKLDDRLSNVEYFSTLTALETSLTQYEVVDGATGLNRFKTGYLVDNFDNPTSVCDFYNAQNTSSFLERKMSAAVDATNVGLSAAAQTGYKIIDNQVMLDYTEVPMISQKTSTRVTNLNPFLTFSWSGQMTVTPSVDTFVDVEQLPDVLRSIDETVTVFREERINVPFVTNAQPNASGTFAAAAIVPDIVAAVQSVNSMNATAADFTIDYSVVDFSGPQQDTTMNNWW